MDDPTLQQGPSSRRPAPPLDRHSLDIFENLGRVAVSLREEELPVLLPSYRGVVGAAKAASRFNECLQHRLEIEGRAADDLEYVSGGGLLLQRLAQFGEQARVLDGDDSLRGEGLDQFDLLVGEGAHLLAAEIDWSRQTIVLSHWDRKRHPEIWG